VHFHRWRYKDLDSLRNDPINKFYTVFVGFGSDAKWLGLQLGYSEDRSPHNFNTLVAIDQLPVDGGKMFREIMRLASNHVSQAVSQAIEPISFG
jgi:hypothetical protein